MDYAKHFIGLKQFIDLEYMKKIGADMNGTFKWIVALLSDHNIATADLQVHQNAQTAIKVRNLQINHHHCCEIP